MGIHPREEEDPQADVNAIMEDHHSAFGSPVLEAQPTQVTYGSSPSPPGTETTG